MVTLLAMGYLSLQQPEKQKVSPGWDCSRLFYHQYMTCVVMYHCTRHLPEIWHDAYHVMSWVTAVGNKPTSGSGDYHILCVPVF